VCLYDQTDDDHSLLPFIDPIKGRHLSSVSKTPLVDPLSAATTLDRTVKDTMHDSLVASNVLPTSLVLPLQLSKLQQNSKTTISTQGVCMYPSSPDDDTSSDTLSAGAIVGIVIGTIIGLIVLLYAGYAAYARYYGYGKHFSLGTLLIVCMVLPNEPNEPNDSCSFVPRPYFLFLLCAFCFSSGTEHECCGKSHATRHRNEFTLVAEQ